MNRHGEVAPPKGVPARACKPPNHIKKHVVSHKSLPSKIQRLWDHEAKGGSVKIVLTGSSIGMMYDVAIDGGSPLYGRVSQNPNGEFLIEQLPFSTTEEFFKGYSDEDKIFAYGIFGGTPQYLRAVDDSQSLSENVSRTLLSKTGGLHNEPETVLRMELDEVNRYFALLKAMAEGNRERNEILQASGVPRGSEGYYLDRLEKLRII